jgi:hypothetical protein
VLGWSHFDSCPSGRGGYYYHVGGHILITAGLLPLSDWGWGMKVREQRWKDRRRQYNSKLREAGGWTCLPRPERLYVALGLCDVSAVPTPQLWLIIYSSSKAVIACFLVSRRRSLNQSLVTPQLGLGLSTAPAAQTRCACRLELW